MAHNNAAEVPVELENIMTTSLLDLNDFALLHVFDYLNLENAINFAETSKRLKSVSTLHFTKYKRLDLYKYEIYHQTNRLKAKKIVSHIGQHLKTLCIGSMHSAVARAVVKNCVNVTTLTIYDCDYKSRIRKWMQQLQLECLTIKCCSRINETSVWLEALKELHITDEYFGRTSMQLTNILQKSTELETLTVNLRHSEIEFNYEIFSKLTKLQCLGIEIYRSTDLANLTKFLKMDGLTKFKLSIVRESNYSECLQRLNSFLEILAERSKIKDLYLSTDTVDQNTFRILKSFHDVTSLGLHAFRNVNNQLNDHWMIHQLVEAQPNLKHLDLVNLFPLNEHVHFLVKNLVKLETFTYHMEDALSQINEMLKTSTSRPMLTIYLDDYDGYVGKYELHFEDRNYRSSYLSYYDGDAYWQIDFFPGEVCYDD